ncbi:DUF547 domain-containing protein [Membranihabitans maritimus]|uniref:DUF547 domain-containing protein n=1 Tax=Membranihabitans maritimus TaxID=2904244 RepID=UPI001F33F548|nr:DUF547 domain-containing protein [Membranihabitans maritimus]
MRQSILVMVFTFMASTIFGQVDYTKWNNILTNTVSDKGQVDYKKIKSSFSDEFTDFLSILRDTDPNSLSKNEQLALWINAYNAFTVKLIVDNYPVSSIKDIENGNPWDKKWIEIGSYRSLSLNDIEHEIIRKEFNEPRIHFAVNCAAQSCPPLLNTYYSSNSLDEQLERQTISFINNSKFNTISQNSIEVSQLFNWYKDDFGNIIAYLNKYIQSPKINSKAQVIFKDYDWSLNN